MPTNSEYGIRQTTERQWARYIQSKITQATPLSNLKRIHLGQNDEEMNDMPLLACACVNARELGGYWEADLDLMTMTSPGTSGGGEDRLQAAMVGQLEGILQADGLPNPKNYQLGDSGLYLLVAAAVSGMTGSAYTVHGFWCEDQGGQVVDGHWVDYIKLKVHCSAASFGDEVPIDPALPPPIVPIAGIDDVDFAP